MVVRSILVFRSCFPENKVKTAAPYVTTVLCDLSVWLQIAVFCVIAKSRQQSLQWSAFCLKGLSTLYESEWWSLVRWLLLSSLWMGSCSITIQMKATDHYFHIVPYVFFHFRKKEIWKIVLNFNFDHFCECKGQSINRFVFDRHNPVNAMIFVWCLKNLTDNWTFRTFKFKWLQLFMKWYKNVYYKIWKPQ